MQKNTSFIEVHYNFNRLLKYKNSCCYCPIGLACNCISLLNFFFITSSLITSLNEILNIYRKSCFKLDFVGFDGFVGISCFLLFYKIQISF